jgi:hypothetical protein
MSDPSTAHSPSAQGGPTAAVILPSPPRKSVSGSPSGKTPSSARTSNLGVDTAGNETGGSVDGDGRFGSATSTTLRNLRDESTPNPLALAVDRILFEYQLRQQSKFHFGAGKTSKENAKGDPPDSSIEGSLSSPRRKAHGSHLVEEEPLAPELLIRGPSSTLLSEATSRPRRPMSARLAASPTFRAFQRESTGESTTLGIGSGNSSSSNFSGAPTGAMSPKRSSKPHQPTFPASPSASRAIVTASQEEALAANRRFMALFETAPVEKYPFHLCHMNESTDRRELQTWLSMLQRGERGMTRTAKWSDDRWDSYKDEVKHGKLPASSSSPPGAQAPPTTSSARPLLRQPSSGRLRGPGASGKSGILLSPSRLGAAPSPSTTTVVFSGIKVTNPVEQRLFAGVCLS